MNKVGKRLLTFFIGVPVIIAILLLDFYNHILFGLLTLVFSALGTNEFYNMISKKSELFPKWLLLLQSISFPILSFVFFILNFDFEILLWIFVFYIFILLIIESFTAKTFEKSLNKIANSLLIIFYTGFLVSFVTKIISFENSTFFIILYFCFVFLCDSAAWFFGILFGKGTRGYIAASPNKSLVGFIGGIISVIALGCLAKLFFPSYLPGGYWKIIICAFVTSVASITGDLIESVFKRSCDTKDSGNVIPGRGGALDCMDSLLMAAPFFYISIYFLYF